MKQIDRDKFRLHSGREFDANRGLIGLGVVVLSSQSPPAEWVVAEGYDGEVSADEWTADERRELADYMIRLWQAFGSGVSADAVTA